MSYREYHVGDKVKILWDGCWCGCVDGELHSLLEYSLEGIEAEIVDIALGDYVLEIPKGILPKGIRQVEFGQQSVNTEDEPPFQLLQSHKLKDPATKAPVKSDGGSSSYYDITLPEWLVDKICQRGEDGEAFIKTEELIEVAFSQDFDGGNGFKSLIRAWGAFNGAGKEGNTLGYELNKIRYSLDKLQQRYDRKA